MIFIKTALLSAFFGCSFGYWYGTVFSKRLLMHRSSASTSGSMNFALVLLGFLLNYVLLFAGLVLLMRHVALNAPLFVCALLAVFGFKVYRLIRRQ